MLKAEVYGSSLESTTLRTGHFLFPFLPEGFAGGKLQQWMEDSATLRYTLTQAGQSESLLYLDSTRIKYH